MACFISTTIHSLILNGVLLTPNRLDLLQIRETPRAESQHGLCCTPRSQVPLMNRRRAVSRGGDGDGDDDGDGDNDDDDDGDDDD